ncbi:tRNA lysidine(34) synthetase TilS [Streptococcus iners]|uniref:tRNA(Ile)-lysidine synthase n=1 Tax=Streptococcus iners TaxID=3028084 RepID=A0AA97A2M4_9STRE|nr:tRNA lysidine(34) synthetase TilS [Streptococcus sp. 29887]MCK4024711.1 tRNA lysidine(34) synthetase TilS [Streptococcus suis]WNY51123.1 tRNA lysidine(34) synthetase TilS [Streptococcus sp. 29887]
MKNKFLKVTLDGHFFDKHEKVLVAVSGGLDSMNLFHLLYEYRQELSIELGIAHINHGQREESVLEENYLKQLAEECKIPFYLSHFKGRFSEEAARKWRYAFFADIMEQEGYTALVTAHHADDQAETVLMRLIRGSRLRHISAIQPIQPFANGELIRPLLSFKKSDFNNVFHFEDASNQSLNYFRNRVRNDYLPKLKQENPKIELAVNNLATDTRNLLQALRDLTKDLSVTDLTSFRQQTRAVQRYLLEEYVEKFPDLQLSRSQFDEVLHILQSKANYKHLLKNNYVLEKDYHSFTIDKIGPQTDEQIEPIMIESEGIFSYGSYIFSLNHPMADAEQVLHFPSHLPILVRGRQAGDTIRINGVTKKLRRWFIDNKIPQKVRQEAIIIEQAGKIYGIVNLASSDLSKSIKNDIIKATLYIKMKE